MAFLTGSYNHTIDAKNRIRIPSKLRGDKAEYEGKFTLYFHTASKRSIAVYTKEELETILEKISDIKESDEDKFFALRRYAMGFIPVESDPQGRFVIPPTLKQYAQIKKDIVICGNIKRIEIWSEENYRALFGYEPTDVEAILKELDL